MSDFCDDDGRALGVAGMVELEPVRGRGDGGDRGLLASRVEDIERRRFRPHLANAAHIKAVPGRKTDMNDAMWIADLAAHGLIRASFVADEEMHELRTLMRTRKQLVRDQTRHVQRIQKTLTEANIRLDSVISDIMGRSGRRMTAGQRDPRKLNWTPLVGPRGVGFKV